VTLIYVIVIAALMVSRLPVLSGKKVGTRVPPEMVLPVIVMAVLFIALLVSYPWQVLGVGTLLYLACLPLGWFSYRGHQRADAAALKGAGGPAKAGPANPSPVAPAEQPDEERPVRLN
jgi:CDP-diacylglycerol--serine O-phosphatidyltransferase